MPTHPIPSIDELASVMKMLYPEGVEVVALPDAIDDDALTYIGSFVDDDDQPVAAIACDVPFAAYAGAALSMIPKGGADDAVAEGEVSDMMLGNLNEFVNICSRWFMQTGTPHLRLDRTYPATEVPEDAKPLLQAGTRLDVQATIPGYGEGRFVCLST